MEVEGKYTNAYIYADIVDDATKAQVQLLVNQEFMTDTKVRIMADCHAGKGCVIGTTIEIKDKVVPNLVGVDIGCGMKCIKLGKIDFDFKGLDDFIYDQIPAGMRVNDTITPTNVNLEDLICYNNLKNIDYLRKSLGSLGGGNHFIEIDKNANDEYYLIIHTGSRNLGKQVAKIYQDMAVSYHNQIQENKRAELNSLIGEYKRKGRKNEIPMLVEAFQKENINTIPKDLYYLEGEGFQCYMHDMDIVQAFAQENRNEIARRIIRYLNLDYDSLFQFETIHNYINMNDKILRKGSIAAYKDTTVLIPLNMRDGCIVARGKSNPEYNYSAPHGAGRIMTRGEAKEAISVEAYRKSMDGIFTTTVDITTVDESPFVYKPMESILNNIKDTVEVIEIIKPVYNFKASED